LHIEASSSNFGIVSKLAFDSRDGKLLGPLQIPSPSLLKRGPKLEERIVPFCFSLYLFQMLPAMQDEKRVDGESIKE